MAEPKSVVDLSHCDREPIHIPGFVQPHGLLLAVEPKQGIITQAAGNVTKIGGGDSSKLLSRTLGDVFGEDAARAMLSLPLSELSEPLYVGTIAAPASAGETVDLIAHTRDGLLILEIEPAASARLSAPQMLAKVRQVAVALDKAPDQSGVLQSTADAVRNLIEYDRVMIYRFLEEGSGAVVAEARADDLPPFLNHHYPASDIPKQARALYLQNLVRVIPDVDYTPAPLIPTLNPITGKPLDMSDCALRSVSPIHVQYLRNMGVAASMSVSIVVDGALWGLIACHHRTAKPVSYELREACKHVGQIVGQQMKAREETELHRQSLRLATARDAFVRSVTTGSDLEEMLLSRVAEVQDLLPSDGAAILMGKKITRAGRVPSKEEILLLGQWLLRSQSDTYATNNLAGDCEPAVAYAAEASGLLATVVSREQPLLVLWFRAEVIETINWAGNPHKAAEPGAEPGLLTPRKSFEAWKETVRHQSRAWSAAEVDAGRRFGQAVLDLRQQNTLRDLNLQLRRTLSDKEVLLAQKDLLMQEVNHRVQNSLQLVNSMLHLQARQTSDEQVKTSFEEASRRIMAISTVHQRLWRRSDHIETVDFGAYLEELRDGLLESWGRSWAGHIRVQASHVLVPTSQAVILALVTTELLTNAVKYAYEGGTGPIEIVVKGKRKELQITVQDQGVGLSGATAKSGLGSRLTQALIGQLGGELEIAPQAPGTRVTITVPLSLPSRTRATQL